MSNWYTETKCYRRTIDIVNLGVQILKQVLIFFFTLEEGGGGLSIWRGGDFIYGGCMH